MATANVTRSDGSIVEIWVKGYSATDTEALQGSQVQVQAEIATAIWAVVRELSDINSELLKIRSLQEAEYDRGEHGRRV